MDDNGIYAMVNQPSYGKLHETVHLQMMYLV